MKRKEKIKIKVRLKITIVIVIAILCVLGFNKFKSKVNGKERINIKQKVDGNKSVKHKAMVKENKEQKIKKQRIKEQHKAICESKYLDKTVFVNSENKKIIKNVHDILVLVNRERNLPADYVPKDLMIPKIPFPFKRFLPKKLMRKEAAEAIEQLFKQAKKENIDLYAISGYRSYKTQQSVFSSSAAANGKAHTDKYVACPGQSEHQTGLAIDLTSLKVGFDVVTEFEHTKEGEWVKNNVAKYGFIIRYPKAKVDITGYSYEPWHIRYVGKEVAQIITSKGITLEEYLRDYK